jgi:hypothetical protein
MYVSLSRLTALGKGITCTPPQCQARKPDVRIRQKHDRAALGMQLRLTSEGQALARENRRAADRAAVEIDWGSFSDCLSGWPSKQ